MHFLSKKNINYMGYLLRNYLPEPYWYNTSKDLESDAILWYRNNRDAIQHVVGVDEINEEFLRYIINIRRFDDTLGFNPAKDPNLITDYYEPIQPCNSEYFDNDITCRNIDLGHALATGEYIPDCKNACSTSEIVEDLKCGDGDLNVRDFLNDSEYHQVASTIYRRRHTPGKKQVAKRRIIAPPTEDSNGEGDITTPVFKRFELLNTNSTDFGVCPKTPMKFGRDHELNEASIRRIENEAMYEPTMAQKILGPYHTRMTGLGELNTLGSGIAPNPTAHTMTRSLYQGLDQGNLDNPYSNSDEVSRWTVKGMRYNQPIYYRAQDANPRYNPRSAADNVLDAIEMDKMYKTTSPAYKDRLFRYFYKEQAQSDAPRMAVCGKNFCGSQGVADNIYQKVYGVVKPIKY